MYQNLYNFEKVLLLLMDPVKGKIYQGSFIPFVLAGAIIEDLISLKKIKIEKTKRDYVVEIIDNTPTGNSFIDKSLAKIDESSKIRKIRYWIIKLSSFTRRPNKILDELYFKGIVDKKVSKFLFFFHFESIPCC